LRALHTSLQKAPSVLSGIRDINGNQLPFWHRMTKMQDRPDKSLFTLVTDGNVAQYEAGRLGTSNARQVRSECLSEGIISFLHKE